MAMSRRSRRVVVERRRAFTDVSARQRPIKVTRNLFFLIFISREEVRDNRDRA